MPFLRIIARIKNKTRRMAIEIKIQGVVPIGFMLVR